MIWKTCSVEAGQRIGKHSGSSPYRNRISLPETGMQKNELTMFWMACYISLVPRVHPGLLYAATFLRACVSQSRRVAVEL